MTYHERGGESKLSAWRDGLRFLRVILAAVAYVRVSRITGPLMPVIQDSVAEFTLLTNQFNAEFGHSTAGQFVTMAVTVCVAVHPPDGRTPVAPPRGG